MTEEEWRATDLARLLLEHREGVASARQLRLLACACCRYLLALLPGHPGRGGFGGFRGRFRSACRE